MKRFNLIFPLQLAMEALCHVLVSNPLAQDPRNEIMDLCSVNQFTPLPVPCPVLYGVWNWSCRWQHFGLVIWAVCIVKIWLRTGCKILFRRTLRHGQWVRAGCVCCWWYIHILLRDRDVYFLFFTTMPAPVFVLILYVKHFIVLWFSTLLFSKSSCMLELCYIYWHFLTVSRMVCKIIIPYTHIYLKVSVPFRYFFEIL